MITLLLATRNEHKVREIRDILGEDFCYWTLNDFPGAPKVIEDAATFVGNATKKAVELATWLSGIHHSKVKVKTGGHLFVLADDSGLEVDALNGAPGVYSARFAALDTGKPGNSSDARNKAKLLRLLRDVPPAKRTARFRCAVALTPVIHANKPATSPVCYLDQMEFQTEVLEGTCEGRIGFEPQGQGGFGYDPLFIPAGRRRTFAELPVIVKNRISHRAKALQKLRWHVAADVRRL